MIKRNLILLILIIFILLPARAQIRKPESGLKREVTLYNPYKPTLPEAKKKSFLPDLSDTSKVRPVFHYEVRATPFLPDYTISPIKAAALLPDPLPKFYKSYVNLGFGNYLTPLAEISITNTRSKKGSIGFYGRHFSTNGNLDLENGKRTFAGYMDNDLSLFGRRIFRKNILSISLDEIQKTRYAYGYDPLISDYSPPRKNIRLSFNNVGAKVTLSSLNMDSTEFSYEFNVSYNYFTTVRKQNQRNLEITGKMEKSYNGFYVGSGLNYDHYRLSDTLLSTPEYIVSVSPFVSKRTDQWSFKLGLEPLLDKKMDDPVKLHVYPDAKFSFSIVPSYISFFIGLSGKLEKNYPLNIVSVNPYLKPDGSIYKLPNTSHDLIVLTGLKGNSGLGGNYLVSASYSVISNMLLFSNIHNPVNLADPQRGNYFSVLTDDAELLNIHAEMNGPVNDRLSFIGIANYYKYTLSKFDFAWNKPNWDGKLGLKYNLREKIIAGLEFTVQGKRKVIVNGENLFVLPPLPDPAIIITMPAHFNLNLSAEYRYSKILSFWTKLDNISSNRYYEWMYYPVQGYLLMFGFTYSL